MARKTAHLKQFQFKKGGGRKGASKKGAKSTKRSPKKK
jgi:hypothetical protein